MSIVHWLGTAYPHPDDIPDERWSALMMSREAYTAMVTERAARDARAPRVGQAAPDFVARKLSATGSMTGEAFSLSALRGRPVGLVFGSYT